MRSFNNYSPAIRDLQAFCAYKWNCLAKGTAHNPRRAAKPRGKSAVRRWKRSRRLSGYTLPRHLISRTYN